MPLPDRYVVLEKTMNSMQKEELANLGIRGVILEETIGEAAKTVFLLPMPRAS